MERQNNLILLLILLIYASCISDNKKESANNSKDSYKNIVTRYYNAENQLIKQRTINTENINGEPVEDNILTHYVYDKQGKLIKEIKTKQNKGISANTDSAFTIYDYNENHKLLKKIHIGYRGDTLEVEKNEYSENKNVKRTLIQKSYTTFDENNSNYDTSRLWIEKIYIDSLKKEIRYYDLIGNKKHLKETEYLNYDKKGRLQNSYVVDINNDTMQTATSKYDNGKLEHKIIRLEKNNLLTKEIYDVNGCITKIIFIDKSKNKKDTTFYTCDENCNILQIKW